MKKINAMILTISAFIMLVCSVTTFANSDTGSAFWAKWMKPFQGPSQNMTTLMMTGNYSESRLLAELIQRENYQPILLIPAVGQDKVYFMPPQTRSAALEIPLSELKNFINFLGVKQIVVIGNNEYVPEKFLEQIPNNQTIWTVTGTNWKNIAYSTGEFLNLPNLSRDYNNLYDKLKSETNYQRADSQIPSADKTVKAIDEEYFTDFAEIQPVDKNETNTIIDASTK